MLDYTLKMTPAKNKISYIFRANRLIAPGARINKTADLHYFQ